jgi:hypothetical protein
MQFTYPTRLSSLPSSPSSFKTIRLLKLHPAPLFIPLTCSLHHVSLSGYETLEVSRLRHKVQNLEPFPSNSTPVLQRKFYDLERCQHRLFWRRFEGGEKVPTDKILQAVEERVLGKRREEGDWEGYDVSRLIGIVAEFCVACKQILEERGKQVDWRERIEERLYEEEDRDVVESFDGEVRDTNTPPYTALSYTWGDITTTPTVPIQCDGQVLHIAENLAAALRVLRKEDESVYVWADAVCINQNDVKEKNNQVPLMREIYEYADTISVWLGEDTAERNAEECFELLELLSAEPAVRFLGTEMSLDEPETAREIEEMVAAETPESDRPIYTKLETLLQRSWFSRTWIIQEVVVGHHPTLYCGSAKISWKSFTRGVERADSLSRLAKPSSFLTLYRARLEFQTGAWAMDLLDLLERHRSALANNNLDKVFAFLGLSHQIQGKDVRIVIDYGLSTGELYAAVTRQALEIMPTLDVLSYPHVRERQECPIEDLPSWAIDWTDGDPQGIYGEGFVRLTDVEEFDAGLTEWYPKHLTITGNTLHLRGILLDEIAKVGPTMSKPVLPGNETTPDVLSDPRKNYACQLATLHATFAIYNQWRAIYRPYRNGLYLTGEPSWEAFARTVLLNQPPLSSTILNLRGVAKCTRLVNFLITIFRFIDRIPQPGFVWRITSWLGIKLLRSAVRLMGEQGEQGEELMVAWLSNGVGRTMFTTKTGYLGMAGPRARVGDSVAIMQGSKAPVVLRRKGEVRDKWELAGDAYVHGVMRGEAVAKRKAAVRGKAVVRERWVEFLVE